MLSAGAALLVILCIVGAIILAFKWPFSKQSLTETITEILPGSTVEISRFKSNIFPHPGCEAEGVVVRRSSNAASSTPLVNVQKISIQARYVDLFLRPGYVARILLNGLRVHVPAAGSGTSNQDDASHDSNSSAKTRVGEIVAPNALLEVDRGGDKPPLLFNIHSFVLNSVSRDKPMAYQVSMTNALPPGEITSTGHLGPWSGHKFGETPVSGSDRFKDASLSVFSGLAGMLSSQDEFKGELDQINLHGSIEIPDFKVKGSSNEVHLSTRYDATVNATNGDVFLRRVESNFLQTTIVVSGKIAGQKGQKGKTTSLDLAVHEGKIQDVLLLFVKDTRSPATGETTFRAKVLITPQWRPFLKEVDLQGDFGIEGGRLTKPQSQAGVDDLSNRARGDGQGKKSADPDPGENENVISNLGGHVRLRGGVARFSNVSFEIPGASAHMMGEYNLLNQKIDFHGTLKTQAKLSQTTSGLKSALLKPFNGLFKKKDAGAEVPVEMTGTYKHPHFGIDLNPADKLEK